MKKILLVLMLALSINAFSQDNEGIRKVFCELVGTGKFMSSKIIVSVDFGQETNIWTGASKQYLVDEKGKAKTFNLNKPMLSLLASRMFIIGYCLNKFLKTKN